MSNEVVLHEAQSNVFNDLFVEKNCRFATVVACRGFGKTYFAAVCAITAIWELLRLPANVPNKNVGIIAPTYNQVVDIYYPLIAYELGIEKYAISSSKDSGKFVFPNQVTLSLISYEAVERMRGKGFYFCVLDEVSSWNKGIGLKHAWESIIQPCIATRWSPKRAMQLEANSPGRALTISTPKGFDYLYDMFNFPEIDTNWKSYHYDYNAAPYLDVSEIERVRRSIAPVDFAREYLASFEESGNSVFYCFDRKRNVRLDIDEIQEDEIVHAAIDFNVGIQATSVFVVRGGQMFFLHELTGHSDTEQLAIHLSTKFKGHKIHAFPDPSGRGRHTSATTGLTDFRILESKGIKCLAKSKAPPIVDSVNAVNRMLKNAADEVNLFIHPRCINLISSLERTSWSETSRDAAIIDKKLGVEHFSDGVRYAVDYLFPIQSGSKLVSRGFNF